jgi:hypothetical protein
LEVAPSLGVGFERQRGQRNAAGAGWVSVTYKSFFLSLFVTKELVQELGFV